MNLYRISASIDTVEQYKEALKKRIAEAQRRILLRVQRKRLLLTKLSRQLRWIFLRL